MRKPPAGLTIVALAKLACSDFTPKEALAAVKSQGVEPVNSIGGRVIGGVPRYSLPQIQKAVRAARRAAKAAAREAGHDN